MMAARGVATEDELDRVFAPVSADPAGTRCYGIALFCMCHSLRCIGGAKGLIDTPRRPHVPCFRMGSCGPEAAARRDEQTSKRRDRRRHEE